MPGSRRVLLFCKLLLTLLTGMASSSVLAEGSWQFGLSEGATHAQPVFEYNNTYADTDTGMRALLRPLYVDLLSDNEVINLALCGVSNDADVSFEVWNRAGTVQLHSWSATDGNVDCADAFTGTLGSPARFAPGAAGTYQIRLFTSGNGANGVFKRFDITVTPDATTAVNPRANQGRLWAYRWAFRCNAGDPACYGSNYSTSADLYAVVDGGFADTYYVWQLDLSNFAGFAYEITANSTGLDSPNPEGAEVAGLSACIDTDDDPADGCGSVSGNRNDVTAIYPIYTSEPALDFMRPTTPPSISNFRFLDDEGEDDSISPGTTITVQDTGNFLFTSNLATTGTYSITLDLNQDGIFGAGDVVLNGVALPGDNTVNWNGRDNSGVVVPDGSYNASIVIKTGEFHFTAADVETSGTTAAGDGLTINAVLNDGSIDRTNKVYWDDATVLMLANPTSYNADGSARYHQWGTFTSGGDGNRAYIDTYVFGASSQPVITRLAVEDSDTPKTRVYGEIFADLNGSGTRDTGEPGIPNVIVAITESGVTGYATSDADGNYAFFTAAASVVVDVLESSLPDGYVRTAGVDGETVNIPAGTATFLGRDGFRPTVADVSGQVRDDLDGDGNLADSDSGLDNVAVALYSDPNGDGDPSDGALVASTITAADGSYTFTDVAEGSFVVVVTAPPGYRASGDADGGRDNRVAVTRAGLAPVTGVDLLESTRGIDIAATAVCINDAPYLQYDVSPVNFDATGLTATIQWIGSDNSIVRTDTNQPLSGGQLLWPGAAVDGSGNGVAWPGWEQVAGAWVAIPSLVRPSVTVRFAVNPTDEVSISYPPATVDCDASPPLVSSPPPPPPPPPSLLAPGASAAGSAVSVPALPLPLLVLLVMTLGLVGGLRAPRR